MNSEDTFTVMLTLVRLISLSVLVQVVEENSFYDDLRGLVGPK